MDFDRFIKNLKGRSIVVPVRTVSARVLDFNAARYAIWFPTFQGDIFTFSFVDPVVAGTGFVVQAGNPPFYMTREHIGDLIRNPLFGITSGAADRPVPFYEAYFMD